MTRRTVIVIVALLLGVPLCVFVSLVGAPNDGFMPLIVDVFCRDGLAAQAVSQDGEYVASSFVSDCGATTSFGTHVEVRRNGTLLGLGQRKFILSARAKIRVNLTWEDDRTLLVEYENQKVDYTDDTPWRDVKIVVRAMQ